MADADKRLRYFNGQFLQQEDFADEQTYHLDRHRRHNRDLHTPGIAEGLEVTAAEAVGVATEVTVQPGTAIDAEGRPIVLAASRDLPLGGHAGETVLVVISFAEEASDPSGLGAGSETRWHERPAVALVDESASPPSAATHLRLARLSVTAGGALAAEPDTSVRIAAGAAVGDEVAMRTLKLKREGVDPSLWAAVTSGATGRVDVAGELHVEGDLSLTGQVDGRDVAQDGSDLDAHRADVGNPHAVTAAQTGAPASIDGVSNPGGDIDLVPSGAITVTPDDSLKRIHLGESHSARTDNPHAVTAAQTGAPVAIDGVSNPGGNIDLVPSGAITVTPNAAQKHVIIGESHSSNTNNPHSVTASQVGALPAKGGIVDGDLQVGSSSVSNRRITAYGEYNSSTADGGLVVRVGSSSTRVKLDNNEIDCTGTLFLNYFSGKQVQVGSFGTTGGLYVYGNIYATGNVSAGGSKSNYVTDSFRNADTEPLVKGDVVVLAEGGAVAHHGRDDDIPVPEVVRATAAHDTRVCGVVSEILVDDEVEAPESVAEEKKKKGEKVEDGIKRLQVIPRGKRGKLDRRKVGKGQFGKMVTLGCFAICKADASAGAISVGDLLTTSPNPGHAQKVTDRSQAIGAILGKALGSLEKGTGTIPVLVLLH